MTNTKKFGQSRFVAVALIAVVLAFFTITASAHAASYAYVNTTGEVKSVTADDWMTAINIAPNIHLHSGVLLLKSAADFGIVGDTI